MVRCRTPVPAPGPAPTQAAESQGWGANYFSLKKGLIHYGIFQEWWILARIMNS